MRHVSTDPLRPLRNAVDGADERDPAAFARAARNAVAQAILAASFMPGEPSLHASSEAHEARARAMLGPDVGGELAALLRGDGDWTSRAIDLLEPLHRVARGGGAATSS